MIQENNTDKYLIKLVEAKEQPHLNVLKQKLTQFPKYFLDFRSNTFLIYDRTCVYIISKKQHKITDLGKTYAITQMIYHPQKNILMFLTCEGQLYAHFISGKTQFLLKKDVKKWILFNWVYGVSPAADLFLADGSGIKFYRADEDKKTLKETKAISGKWNSFLYEPKSQVLAGFPTGDCKSVMTFFFEEERAKSWFKGPQIPIYFENDQELLIKVQKTKSLGFRNSILETQLFTKIPNDQYYSQLIHMNNRCYLLLYFGNQGKLKLYPVVDELNADKQIIIKLPSDSIPYFNVIDNMLVINLTNEKITFIYDVSNSGAQMLVSPFPIEHESRKEINPYRGNFRGKRHVLPDGTISKWKVNLSCIYFYLKNESQVFDFLHKRKKAKMELLVWLRKHLLSFKQLNLSRFWKLILLKTASNQYSERDIITMPELFANVFYTLSIDELTPKQPLMNAILECFRQATQIQVKIPLQLQSLALNLLLECSKYETLVFLCHNDVIKDNPDFAQTLINKGLKEKKEIILTLGIDMANRTSKPQKVFQCLLFAQRVREAKRYLKANFESIETLSMVQSAKYIEDQTIKIDYLKFVRAYIMRKLPAMTDKYLDEAEHLALEK